MNAVRKLSRREIVGLTALIAVGVIAETFRSVASAAEDFPLAIRGYDPVAYFKEGHPARGRSEFAYQWDEHRYQFTSAEHRALFAADPLRYAPQFAGFCAMSLTRGQLVAPNPEYWLISDGKLYLFGKSIGPDLFKKSLAENKSKADQHRELVQKR
jgi:hypothetical protein